MRMILIIGTALAGVALLFMLRPYEAAAPVGTVVEEETATSSSGIAFRYPKTLGTSYISLTDWPPMIRVLPDAFSCTEAGDEAARAGRTERRTISGQEYCVTVVSEGAAGSIYRQYAYAFPFEDGTAIFTFSLRFPQCLNYDEPQRTDCAAEEQSLPLDAVVDEMRATAHR